MTNRPYRTLAASIAILVLIGSSVWAQTVDKKTIQFARKHLAIGPYEECAVADLNKDGELDIVYGPFIFYGPDNAMQTFRPSHVAQGFIHANSDHVYDVDKDGWDDIIIGGWGTDGIVWFKNPGNSAKDKGEPWTMHKPWEQQTLTKHRGKMEMVVAHDFDGDGVPEFQGSCYAREEPLEIWRFGKNEKGEPVLNTFVLGADGGGHGVAYGDVNNDGREDVLCEIGWYERPEGDIWAKPWKFHGETSLNKMHPSCPFAVKDLNKDGRLDIIFGRAHAYGLYWWEQLAPDADGKTNWKQHVIDESWSQVHMVELADLDGDGIDELVTGKSIWAHNGTDPGAADPVVVYYYSWNPKDSTWTRHTIADKGEGIALGRQFKIVDLNKDGKKDIVGTSKMGLWVFFNQGYDKPTSNDLGKIQPPGGVPLPIVGSEGILSVDGLNKVRRRLEAVPKEDLEKWVVELERIMDKKLKDGLPSARQACRTDFVIHVSMAFDDLKWNPKTADDLFKRAQTMPATEAKVWKEAFEVLLKKKIGQTDDEIYDGGPAWAVPLVLIPVDALHEDQKYSSERGKKYLARMKQLTADDVSLWKNKVDQFVGTKLDAAVNIILLDDYFDKEKFQREKFEAAIGARKK